MSNQMPFTRRTLLAASDFFERAGSSAKFDLMVQRLELTRWVPSGDKQSVNKKRFSFNEVLLERVDQFILTREGQMTLGEAFIREAIRLMNPSRNCYQEQKDFERCLSLDGFDVSWDEGECGAGSPPWLRRGLPKLVDLPAGDDQVHQVLQRYDFSRSQGHLDQAIDAHTRGDWAAANAQIRTFMESLFLEIAGKVVPNDLATSQGLNNAFQALARCEFLSEPRSEWTPDGKGMLNGLLKMLNSDGSHKGLSNEAHSTFRLHVALVTARMMLNRLAQGQL